MADTFDTTLPARDPGLPALPAVSSPDAGADTFSKILTQFAKETASNPKYQEADDATKLAFQKGFYQTHIAPLSDANNNETNIKQFQMAAAPTKTLFTSPEFLNADIDTRKQVIANNLVAKGQDPSGTDIVYGHFITNPVVRRRAAEAGVGELEQLPRAALQLVNPSNVENNQAINDQVQREKQFPVETMAASLPTMAGIGKAAGAISKVGPALGDTAVKFWPKVASMLGRGTATGAVTSAATPIETTNPGDTDQVTRGKEFAGLFGAGASATAEVVPEVARYLMSDAIPAITDAKFQARQSYAKGAAAEAAGSGMTSTDILNRDIGNLSGYKGDELSPVAAKSQALNSATSDLGNTKKQIVQARGDLFDKQTTDASEAALNGQTSNLNATAKKIETQAQIDQAIRDNQVAAINKAPFLTPRAPANSDTVAASFVPKAVMAANKAKLAAIDSIKADLQRVAPLQTGELQQAVMGSGKDIVGANALNNSPTINLINRLPDKPMTLYNFTQLKNQLDSEVVSGLNSNGVSLSSGDMTALKTARDNVNALYADKMSAIQTSNPALYNKVSTVDKFISDTNNKLFRSTANDVGALAGTDTNKIQSVLSPIYQDFKAGKAPDFSHVWNEDPSIVVPDLKKALGGEEGFNQAFKNAYARRVQELLPQTPTDAAGKATAINSLLSSSDGKKMLQFGEAIDVGNGQTAADVLRNAAKEHTNQANIVAGLEGAPKATDFSNAPFLQNITQNKEPAALVKGLIDQPKTRADMVTQFANPAHGPALQKDTQLAIMQHIDDLAKAGDSKIILSTYGSKNGQELLDNVFSNNPTDKALVENVLTPAQKTANQDKYIGTASTDNTDQKTVTSAAMGATRHFFTGSSMELGENFRALNGALDQRYKDELQAILTNPEYAATVAQKVKDAASAKEAYQTIIRPKLMESLAAGAGVASVEASTAKHPKESALKTPFSVAKPPQ